MMIERYVLSDGEREQITALVHTIEEEYTIESDRYLIDASYLARKLPETLVKKLNEFKYLEQTACLIISGYPLNDHTIGLTPIHWKECPDPALSRAEEIFFTLCGTVLGDVFGWATQQNGHYVHNILPIKGDEQEQLGSGSETVLWWHTEEAFHEYRADYLGLFCFRNPDQVATTYTSIDHIELDGKTKEILSQPRFYIMPDESHLNKNNHGGANSETFERLEAKYEQKPPISVLFGDVASPYLRIDPFFMGIQDENDIEAQEALQKIIHEIDRSLVDIVLSPGDILFVDNYRAVHGRRPFRAKYAGADRWLKRINITRDIRKSRDSRPNAESRLIGTIEGREGY